MTAVDPTPGRLAIGGIDMGDTGWRNVSGLLINGFTVSPGGVLVRRVGQTVSWYLAGLKNPSGTNEYYLASIPGFKHHPSGYGVYWSLQVSIGAARVVGEHQSGQWICAAGSEVWGIIPPYLTSDPWPTSLPGTPS